MFLVADVATGPWAHLEGIVDPRSAADVRSNNEENKEGTKHNRYSSLLFIVGLSTACSGEQDWCGLGRGKPMLATGILDLFRPC